MTQGSGHPDWQAYAQWRSGALINVSQAVAPGVPFITPAVNVSNWQTLLVIAQATTKGAHLQMQTAPSVNTPDAGWSIQQLFELPAVGGRLHVQLTPLDRAVRFRFTDADGAVASNVTLSAYGLNVPSVPGAVRFSDNFTALTGFNLANGTSQTLSLPVQGMTRAQLLCTVPNATPNGFSATLWTTDALGGFVDVVASFRNITTTLNTSVFVPTDPLLFQLSNVTGGAVNGINGSLTGVY